MMKRLLDWAADNTRLRDSLMRTTAAREMAHRFVPGDSLDECLVAVRDLRSKGLTASIDRLGEDVTDRAAAVKVADEYVAVLGRLANEGLTDTCEVSLKLSSVGQALDETLAQEQAARVCAAAQQVGTTVTLDMEAHETIDSTLRILAALRETHPETGAVLQAELRRTEDDCRALAHAGSRVRLCKGAYLEPDEVAFDSKREVDRSFVRCLRILMEGDGYPMIATHDQRIIEITEALAERTGRGSDQFEFQMLYGVRPLEQRRLVDVGRRVRVYVPFGDDWYRYYLRRLGERPANVWFFARSLLQRR